MIDWHSHILPGIDDGSRDTAESLAMLKMEMQQGVETVVATPHFFADNESVSDFIARRQKSFLALMQSGEDMPKLVMGAEVRYYPGISKMAGLEELCIGDSKLLLLEMSMEKWTEYTVRELVEIAGARKVKLVLAHIERYFPLQNQSVLDRLYEADILMQVNASYLTGFTTKRKALTSLLDGGIHIIGSDCHNVRYRPPRLGAAYDVIRKKFGDEFVYQFSEYGKNLLTIN